MTKQEFNKIWAGKKTTVYWVFVSILALINLSTVVFGFHPHHDGLMLATVKLLNESYVNDGDWPFNQYGLFWALPFMFLSLFIDGSNLLFGIRFLTLLFYAGAGFFTYKIALITYGSRVAKIALILFFLLRPLGLEPLPWPSSISMILTISSLWFLLSGLKSKSLAKARVSMVVVGAMTSANLFSRIQVGLLLFIATIVILTMFYRKFTLFFVLGFIAFTALLFSFFAGKKWLIDALTDEFLFGWSVAGSEDTDKSLPKTSLLISILLIFIMGAYIYGKKNLRLFGVLGIVSSISALTILFSINLQVFVSLYGKFVVGLVFAFLAIAVFQCLGLWKKRQLDQIIVTAYAGASASQIYPLFDVMHAWWGITPLVILIAAQANLVIVKTSLRSLLVLSTVIFSLLITFPYLNSIKSGTSEVSSRDMNNIRLDSEAQREYEKLDLFFRKNLTTGSKVLNLCSDARVFFSHRYVISASRHFVYWKTMASSERVTQDFLNSKPDYVLVCSPNDQSNKNQILTKFTSEPYTLNSEMEDIEIYSITSMSGS